VTSHASAVLISTCHDVPGASASDDHDGDLSSAVIALGSGGHLNPHPAWRPLGGDLPGGGPIRQHCKTCEAAGASGVPSPGEAVHGPETGAVQHVWGVWRDIANR
jgi:hypothetical protein